ncbi:MAG: hypothetical protein HXX17_16535 [Geobacteraceae bacterium]|nr:hypothetical protein [Geobacteraceae bacterium]
MSSRRGQPTFDQYHRIGEQVAPQLDHYASYRQIGDSLGITKQRDWHIGMVALGKVVCGLKETFREE